MSTPCGVQPRDAKVGDDRFARDIARLLITFVAVAAIDVVAISLITHKLRFWFPVWLDPRWDTRPDPWVVYSQSYAAGIYLIPVLGRIVDREFLRSAGTSARAAFWGTMIAVFGFVLWWKGSLMVQHHKHWEALAWLALTVCIWWVVRAAETLPAKAQQMGRRKILGGLMFGVACFFLAMAVLDPVVQLGVQRVAFSTGLGIEVGFFVPAGIVLMVLARRMRRNAEVAT